MQSLVSTHPTLSDRVMQASDVPAALADDDNTRFGKSHAGAIS
jgi:hypothetical protein